MKWEGKHIDGIRVFLFIYNKFCELLEFDSISFVDTYFYWHCVERDLAELYDLKCSLSLCLLVRVCLLGTFGTD